MAFWFGTSPAVAGFLIAFRLSNLLRRLFGEGALLNGFIPFFESKRREDPKAGAIFFRDLFWSLSAILVILIVVLEVGLFGVLKFFTLSGGTRPIIYMTMVMLPGLLFICLFGLSMALLECEKNFFTPGVAPVVFNLVWIGAIWSFRNHLPYTAMMGISAAIVLAFFIQWWVTVPGIRRYTKEFLTTREWYSGKLFTKELRDMVVPLTLGVVGVAAVQINSAVDVIIARFASLEGPAYLSYAHRLQQLPLALFGIAISSALMPALTRAVKLGDHKHYASLLSFGFARSFSLLFPGTIAIFVLGGVSVNLLYGRGAFNHLSTVQTTLSLWGYGVGLIPSAFVLLLAPAFYAKRDFWTPTYASLIAVLINLVLSIIVVFVFHWNAMGIAFATSLTSIYNMWYLLKKMDVEIMAGLKRLFLHVALVSLISGAVVLLISHCYFHEPTLRMLCTGRCEGTFTRSILRQFQQFSILTGIYGITFLSLSYFFNIEHVLDLFRLKKQNQS